MVARSGVGLAAQNPVRTHAGTALPEGGESPGGRPLYQSSFVKGSLSSRLARSRPCRCRVLAPFFAFHLNISYPATGCQKCIEIDDERRLLSVYDLRMAQEVDGGKLGDEFAGYVFRIAGGNDKQGFPMKQVS